MKLVLAEPAAVIPGRDLDHARTTRRLDAGAERVLDRLAIQAVHDDLEHRVHARRQRARDADASAERRAVGVVGRRDHLLVTPRSNLAAASDDAAREGEDDAADSAHGVDGRFRRRQRGPLILSKNQKVAAADRRLHAEGLLHQELALHHVFQEVAPTVEKLARLKAITEMAQQAADDDSLGRLWRSVEARGRGTREHGLSDAIDQALPE